MEVDVGTTVVVVVDGVERLEVVLDQYYTHAIS